MIKGMSVGREKGQPLSPGALQHYKFGEKRRNQQRRREAASGKVGSRVTR